MWRKGKPLILLVEMQTGTATPKNSMEVLQKVKNRATLWSINYTTRYLSKGYKHSDSKGHMHPNVYSSNLHNSLTMERAHMSIDRWMDKEDVVYIYNGRLLGNQKGWIPTIYVNIDELEGIVLGKVSQSGKDNDHMVSLTGGKYKTMQRTIWEGREKSMGSNQDKPWVTLNQRKQTEGP